MTGPVLGMIDSVAEKLNYYPVHAEPVTKPKPARSLRARRGVDGDEPAAGQAPMEGLLDDEGEPQVA